MTAQPTTSLRPNADRPQQPTTDETRSLWIPDQVPIQLDRPLELSGDPVMPEFRSDLRAIWPPESAAIAPNSP